MTLPAALTLVISFLLALVTYPALIWGLRRFEVGQVIQAELSPEHQRKAGTPTGGGVLFVFLGILAGLLASLRGHSGAAAITVALILFGLLGLIDDLAKLKISQVGIPARLKLPLQLVAAVPVVFLAHSTQHWLPSSLEWVYWPLGILAVAGAVNGVNFSDGLDGLCAPLVVIALGGMVFLLPGGSAGEKAVALTLIGGLIAFLIYNWHPARVFMGDAGALGAGAALAAMALQQGWVLLLLLLGAVFVIEVCSVVLQVGYFKLTKGKRLIPMAPLHFSFQLRGWSEPQVVLLFTAVQLVVTLAAGWLARISVP